MMDTPPLPDPYPQWGALAKKLFDEMREAYPDLTWLEFAVIGADVAKPGMSHEAIVLAVWGEVRRRHG